MRGPRVVHVVQELGLGGLERTVQALVRHADPRDPRPEVVCASGGGPLVAEIERGGIPVRVSGLRDYYPASIASLARSLRKVGAGVVHCHGFFAGVLGRAAAWWAGVPVLVHHLHTADPTLRGRHRRLERLLARVTTRVICCSRAVAEDAAERLGIPRPLLTVIPNGIDPPPETSRTEALGLLGNPAPPVLGCVGSLTRHKGQAVLLEAVRRLPGAFRAGTVVLIGDGPERGALERLAGQPGGGWIVRFAGARCDARRLLPALDVAVVPSLREGLGLAALEAMDAGLPVIASRVDGLPEVVEEDRTGLLVRPGHAGDLAAAIVRVLSLQDRGRSLGLRGRQAVEARFRAATMARRVRSIYEEALDERRAA